MRWGNGLLRFRRVRLLRSDGKSHVNFTTDESMTISMDLEARDDIEDLVVGISLHRADGSMLGGMNTKVARVRVPSMSAGERMNVRYTMPQLRILAGTYRATVAATNSSYSATYDWIEQGMEFRVTDEIGRPGLMELGGEWTINGARGVAVEAQAS
jgi:hypothetical protein